MSFTLSFTRIVSTKDGGSFLALSNRHQSATHYVPAHARGDPRYKPTGKDTDTAKRQK